MNKYEKFSGMPIDEYRHTWFIGLPLRWKHFWHSVSRFKDFHLADDVIYNNEHYFINNGTTYDGNGIHLWDICRKDEDRVGVSIAVPESDLKKAKTWFNFKHSLLSYYKWYMQCWYKIDVNKKIIDKLVEDINNE